MQKLYYCNTVYKDDEIIHHVNPLILEKHKHDRILFICARDPQINRILNFKSDNYPNNNVTVVGWWNLQKIGIIGEDGFVDRSVLLNYKCVVILDKARVHEIFHKLVGVIEQECKI